MQREIRKKAAVYSILAVLLATILGAVCLNFGIRPLLPPISVSALSTFSSYEELENYLNVAQKTPYYYLEISESPRIPLPSGVIPSSQYVADVLGGVDVFSAVPKGGPEYSVSSPEYSGTNVQVAGVDEADLVKTDGEYLYVVSGNNVTILKAYPAEDAEILSQISLNGTLRGVFINGNRLAVFGESYFYQPVEAYVTEIIIRLNETTISPAPQMLVSPYPFYSTSSETFVKVYDVSNRTNPILIRDVTTNGTYFSSRMIGDYVYAVTSQPTLWRDSGVILPMIISLNETKIIQPTEIYYSNVSDNSYEFTTIVAFNLKLNETEPEHKTFLLGSASCVYVSLNNIYITMQKQEFFETSWTETTPVYRVHIQDGEIECEAKGEVPGRVLNQFSMDEYGEYFRIATTIGQTWSPDNPSRNNLYVLNMSLGIIGKLEGLALTEEIYSARFMGDKFYLVTFRQKDPFFVIDLSNPFEPKVLGYLIITGFSDYLHPYDENYIIGVGKEGSNVKLSLFDVTNVTAPAEKAKFIVEAEWSDSTVLREEGGHKAFLFDKSKQLLVIPVSMNWAIVKDEYYTKGFWQGAYVFNITLSDGFVLRGNVTHQENGVSEWESGGYWVNRALYIDDVLYTISNKKVKMNDLETLEEINEVELP